MKCQQINKTSTALRSVDASVDRGTYTVYYYIVSAPCKRNENAVIANFMRGWGEGALALHSPSFQSASLNIIIIGVSCSIWFTLQSHLPHDVRFVNRETRATIISETICNRLSSVSTRQHFTLVSYACLYIVP